MDEIISRLEQKFSLWGWYDVLHPFVRTDDFRKIIAWLCDEYNNGRHFYPNFGKMFLMFAYIRPEEVKVLRIRKKGWKSWPGVLELPCALSHDGNVHHYRLWKPFVNYIVDYFK